MIEVQNLTKHFGKLVALDDLSFEIAKGEAISLWGPNGAGKTTALRCLLGLIPYEGRISVDGHNVLKKEKTVRSLIGFVPQELSFQGNWSVEETVDFFRRLRKASRESTTKLLQRMELFAHVEKQISALSGGMKQRLALLIALLNDPPIMVLDEPTSNLDLKGRDNLQDFMLSLKDEGKTLIFSSHRLEEVAQLAERILVLEKGSLIADCKPSQIHEFIGRKAMLRVYVDEEAVEPALVALKNQGMSASPNGKGIWIEVTADMKGLPFHILHDAGIEVRNFDLDHQNKG